MAEVACRLVSLLGRVVGRSARMHVPAETCSLSQESRVRVRGRALTGSQAEAKLHCHSTVSPWGTLKPKGEPSPRPKAPVIHDMRSISLCLPFSLIS